LSLADLAASERSSGRKYADVVKWHLDAPIPEAARDLVVKDLAPISIAILFFPRSIPASRG